MLICGRDAGALLVDLVDFIDRNKNCKIEDLYQTERGIHVISDLARILNCIPSIEFKDVSE